MIGAVLANGQGLDAPLPVRHFRNRVLQARSFEGKWVAMAGTAVADVHTRPNEVRRWSSFWSMGLAASLVIITLALVGTTPPASAASPATTWNKAIPATSPPARFDASMAYDSGTGQLVLFGGIGAFASVLHDTWVWNGTTWTNVTPSSPSSSPPARSRASMAYDTSTGQLVLFGGLSNTGHALADTWTWDGTAWSNATPSSPSSSPPIRYQASMAYDGASGQLVLFGGQGSAGLLNDTWTWSGTTWTNVTPTDPSSSPSPLEEASLSYDSGTDQLVLFGGFSSGYTNATWTWSGTTWTNVTPSDPLSSPPARGLASMDYDGVIDQLVLFGGFGSGSYADTWTWDGTTWTQISPALSPSARYGAPMAFDPGSAQLLLFGGDQSGVALADTWTYGPSQAPSITSSNSARFSVGTPGSFTVTTAGNPTSGIAKSGSLPAGVNFTDNGDGTASLVYNGAASTSGTFPITITASNGVTPAATQPFSVTMAPTLAITTPALMPTGTSGATYSQALTATGGNAPDTWSTTTSGGQTGLPPGVTLSGSTMSGTPTTLGTYTFTIKVTDSGTSPASATRAETLIVTATPTGLAGVANSASSVTLSWNPVSNALRYNIFRSTTGAAGSYTFAKATTSTTWTNLVSGTGNTTYYYEVSTVVGSTYDQTSAFTTPVSVTTQAVPPAPTPVTATAGSASQINVSWGSVMGATSYTVSRATTSGGPYAVVSRQPGTTYANNGLTPGATFYYVVTATTSIGTSAHSTQATATTLAQPVAPTVTATVASTTSVHVSWTAVTATGSTGPTTYDVYSSTTPGGPYTLQAVLTTTSWPNNGLTHGTTYYYVVKAVVPGVGTSPLSAQKSATP